MAPLRRTINSGPGYDLKLHLTTTISFTLRSPIMSFTSYRVITILPTTIFERPFNAGEDVPIEFLKHVNSLHFSQLRRLKKKISEKSAELHKIPYALIHIPFATYQDIEGLNIANKDSILEQWANGIQWSRSHYPNHRAVEEDHSPCSPPDHTKHYDSLPPSVDSTESNQVDDMGPSRAYVGKQKKWEQGDVVDNEQIGALMYDEVPVYEGDNYPTNMPPKGVDMSSLWVGLCIEHYSPKERNARYPCVFTQRGLVSLWANKGSPSLARGNDGKSYYNVAFGNFQLIGDDHARKTIEEREMSAKNTLTLGDISIGDRGVQTRHQTIMPQSQQQQQRKCTRAASEVKSIDIVSEGTAAEESVGKGSTWDSIDKSRLARKRKRVKVDHPISSFEHSLEVAQHNVTREEKRELVRMTERMLEVFQEQLEKAQSCVDEADVEDINSFNLPKMRNSVDDMNLAYDDYLSAVEATTDNYNKQRDLLSKSVDEQSLAKAVEKNMRGFADDNVFDIEKGVTKPRRSSRKARAIDD